MNKLELWNRVSETDPDMTKKVRKNKRDVTAIDAYSQIKAATTEFGPYGGNWGFRSILLDYNLISYHIVVFKGKFFHPTGEFDVINSMKVFLNNDNTYLDSEFAKKLETDSLTKALSRLGFNADVFMGKFDDIRYVQELQQKKQSNQDEEKYREFLSKWADYMNSSHSKEGALNIYNQAYAAWDNKRFRDDIDKLYKNQVHNLELISNQVNVTENS